MSRIMLGAYWSYRPESLDDCVNRAKKFFEQLVVLDDSVAHWYELGRTRQHALRRPVDVVDPSVLRDILNRGRSKTDIGRENIDALGFRIDLWNGGGSIEDEGAIAIQCGGGHERIGNRVIVDIPPSSTFLTEVIGASALLKLVADVWRPSWAGVMTRQAMNEREFSAKVPFVDWLVYLPRMVDFVPPPGYAKTISDFGTIIVVQPEIPTGSREDLSRIALVEQLLEG